jgi:hypothetical protein
MHSIKPIDQAKSSHSLAGLPFSSHPLNPTSAAHGRDWLGAGRAKCQLELREALEWNDVVESKWGVVHLNVDDDDGKW